MLELHHAPCRTKKKTGGSKYIPLLTEAELVTEFWEEYKCFNSRTGDYKKERIWLDKNAQNFFSHLCHM